MVFRTDHKEVLKETGRWSNGEDLTTETGVAGADLQEEKRGMFTLNASIVCVTESRVRVGLVPRIGARTIWVQPPGAAPLLTWSSHGTAPANHTL